MFTLVCSLLSAHASFGTHSFAHTLSCGCVPETNINTLSSAQQQQAGLMVAVINEAPRAPARRVDRAPDCN